MARKNATLNTVLIAQDFLTEHWNWTTAEQASLMAQDISAMGNIIKTRLENGGCQISEMYTIKHDKDEHKLWNEYKMIYEINFTSNHAHFLIKFAQGKTLEEIANLIGIQSNYIEKPKAGRYSYDNNLAYLIHIKYAQKYQYNAKDVVTVCGKDYMAYYRERHEAWMRGRAERSVIDAKALLNFLKVGIVEGTITEDDIIMNEEWSKVYILYQKQFKELIANKKIVEFKRKKLIEQKAWQMAHATTNNTVSENEK